MSDRRRTYLPNTNPYNISSGPILGINETNIIKYNEINTSSMSYSKTLSSVSFSSLMGLGSDIDGNIYVVDNTNYSSELYKVNNSMNDRSLLYSYGGSSNYSGFNLYTNSYEVLWNYYSSYYYSSVYGYLSYLDTVNYPYLDRYFVGLYGNASRLNVRDSSTNSMSYYNINGISNNYNSYIIPSVTSYMDSIVVLAYDYSSKLYDVYIYSGDFSEGTELNFTKIGSLLYEDNSSSSVITSDYTLNVCHVQSTSSSIYISAMVQKRSNTNLGETLFYDPVIFRIDKLTRSITEHDNAANQYTTTTLNSLKYVEVYDGSLSLTVSSVYSYIDYGSPQVIDERSFIKVSSTENNYFNGLGVSYRLTEYPYHFHIPIWRYNIPN